MGRAERRARRQEWREAALEREYLNELEGQARLSGTGAEFNENDELVPVVAGAAVDAQGVRLPSFLRTTDVARMFRVHPKTIETWRSRDGLPCVRLHGSVRFDLRMSFTGLRRERRASDMPKLPKGMFQRGRSYYVRFRVDGKDVWRSLGADYPEAKRKLRQLKTGAVPLNGRLTVTEAAGRWLETYIATARTEKGRRTAATRVRLYLKPFSAFVSLKKVGPEHIRRYRLWLEGKDISPTTVWHILSAARCLRGWCEEVRLVERSPFPRRVMPRLQEQPPDRLSEDEAARVLAIREPYGFVVRLALGTGPRWGELIRAQASHVEGDMLVVSQTKSGRVRRVPLTPELLRELRNRVGRLVPNATGSPGSFAKAVHKEAGLVGFHVHQMRHTFACSWTERGGSLAALQRILGHASVVTTQRYARLSDNVVREKRSGLPIARQVAKVRSPVALHPDEVSMLRESLPEYLTLANLGLGTTKPDGGILGYPTTQLLMAVVDAIGSYYREDPKYRVRVDGVDREIKTTSDHIFILNSDYFGFDFTEDQLRDIYQLCRSPLTHNAVVGNGHVLVIGRTTDPAFEFKDGVVVTSVAGLGEACRKAVGKFLPVLDKVVPGSKAIGDLQAKADRAASKRAPGGAPGVFTTQASAFGRPKQ